MKGLQQKELADILGVNENSIVNWEKDRGTPIKSHIKRAIEVLGLSPKTIIKYKDIFASRQEELLDLVCEKERISKQDYSHIGDSWRGAYNDLCWLVEVGILKKERRGRHTYYALND